MAVYSQQTGYRWGATYYTPVTNGGFARVGTAAAEGVSAARGLIGRGMPPTALFRMSRIMTLSRITNLFKEPHLPKRERQDGEKRACGTHHSIQSRRSAI